MTDRSNRRPDDESIARGVAGLPGVAPDDAFRERLRASFVDGGIDSSPRADARPDVSAEPAPARRTRRFWPVGAAAGLVAAALLLIFTLNAGPAYDVVAINGPGPILVDGVEVSARSAGGLADHLRPGARIELGPETMVDVRLPGVALYEIAAGSRVTLPDSPGRWFARATACSLSVGELRIKTGPEFAGAELRVHTPDGMAVVTGTMLSVQCDSTGTCVCLLEGVARVGVDEADLEPVAAGNRKIMMRDGTKEIVPVKPMHRDGVLDFERRVGSRVEE